MLTLLQAARTRGPAGEPLPDVWQTLADAGTQFQRGQLALVVAGPGTGKSAFVLSYALKSGVSGLYFSADSGKDEQVKRALSIITGNNMAWSKQIVLADDFATMGPIFNSVPIRFSFDSSPNLDHIELEILAYEELYGDFPEIIVIDNVLDVLLEADAGDYKSLDGFMAWVHEIARKTSACVVCLHHTKADFNNTDKAIPLNGIQGQIGRVPELVLTLHKGEGSDGEFGGVVNVSTVKNRGGISDATGGKFVPFDFDGFHMRFTEREQEVVEDSSPFFDRERAEDEMNYLAPKF